MWHSQRDVHNGTFSKLKPKQTHKYVKGAIPMASCLDFVRKQGLIGPYLAHGTNLSSGNSVYFCFLILLHCYQCFLSIKSGFRGARSLLGLEASQNRKGGGGAGKGVTKVKTKQARGQSQMTSHIL